MLSLSLLRIFTLLASVGCPSFVQVMAGWGFPCKGENNPAFNFQVIEDVRNICRALTGFLILLLYKTEDSSLTYTEGDYKVDFLSDFHHITLPQETWQANLGAIYKKNQNYTFNYSFIFRSTLILLGQQWI